MKQTSRMTRLLIVVLLTALAAGGALLIAQDEGDEAQPKRETVTLKDGRTFTGVVTETEEEIQISTSMGDLSFSKDDVAKREPYQSPKEAYQEKRGQIDTDKAEDLYELAKWVQETYGDNPDLTKDERVSMLELARRDLQDAMKIQEDYTRAELLLRQVDASLTKMKPGGEDAATPGTAGQTTAETVKYKQEDLISERGVYWIRLEEIKKTDRVPITFDNNVIQRFIQKMEPVWGDPAKKNEFLKMSPAAKAETMIYEASDDTEILQDILIKGDPAFMQTYRNRLWPFMRNSCARPNCHGGAKAKGGLIFFGGSQANDRVAYSNFVITSAFRKGKDWMIDRQNLQTGSLLLLYGLDPQFSQKPHPKVNGFQPLFKNVEDPTYKLFLEWMKDLRGPIHPDYHLDWTPPAGMKIDADGKPDIQLD